MWLSARRNVPRFANSELERKPDLMVGRRLGSVDAYPGAPEAPTNHEIGSGTTTNMFMITQTAW
jgi:hypothetical protein